MAVRRTSIATLEEVLRKNNDANSLGAIGLASLAGQAAGMAVSAVNTLSGIAAGAQLSAIQSVAGIAAGAAFTSIASVAGPVAGTAYSEVASLAGLAAGADLSAIKTVAGIAAGTDYSAVKTVAGIAAGAQYTAVQSVAGIAAGMALTNLGSASGTGTGTATEFSFTATPGGARTAPILSLTGAGTNWSADTPLVTFDGSADADSVPLRLVTKAATAQKFLSAMAGATEAFRGNVDSGYNPIFTCDVAGATMYFRSNKLLFQQFIDLATGDAIAFGSPAGVELTGTTAITQNFASFEPKINQASAVATNWQGLNINATVTAHTGTGGWNLIYGNVDAVGAASGLKHLLNLAVGGTPKFSVNSDGAVTSAGSMSATVSFIFADDPDTMFRRRTSNACEIRCAGIDIMQWSTSGAYLETGDLTIDSQFGRAVQTTTLGAGVTTLAVTRDIVVLTGDGAGNTLATITGGITGQVLRILFVDGLVQITDDNTHAANTVDLSAAFTSADDTVLTLLFDGTSWYETGRSVN